MQLVVVVVLLVVSSARARARVVCVCTGGCAYCLARYSVQLNLKQSAPPHQQSREHGDVKQQLLELKRLLSTA